MGKTPEDRLRINRERGILVDPQDEHLLRSWLWTCYKYPQRNAAGVTVYLHKEILQVTSEQEVDHINNDVLDARRQNLRIANRKQNLANVRKRRDSSSQFKGVRWNTQRSKWQARIRVDGKQRHLGLFDSEEAAAEAYNRASIELQGSFAKAASQ